MKTLLFIILALLFTACSTEKKKSYDGRALLEQKCAECHNIDLPPKTFQDEAAPPMMAVAFHIVNFMQTPDESARVPKAVAFVKDYVLNPSKSKSFCDKKSLEEYGLMPSQKGKVTQEELEAIAKYIFLHFTQENLQIEQKRLNEYNSMPQGKKIALKNNCLTCHKIDRDLVGPSFKKILLRYNTNTDAMKRAILHGSHKRWKESKGAIMPPFKNLSDEELEMLINWLSTHD